MKAMGAVVSSRRGPRPSFFDEPTVQYDADCVPVAVDEDETQPVDVGEMQLAARRSRALREPLDPTPVPAARSSRHVRPRPFVELVRSGAGAIVRLPVHRVSETGIVLTVPPGTVVDLADDAPVEAVVHLTSGLNRDNVVRARLPAVVVCARPPGPALAGGVSLRWDVRDPETASALATLLAGSGLAP